MPAVVGQPAPDFSLRDTAGNTVSLGDLKGSKALVVFIPFPNTGICDTEACDLRDDYSALGADGSKVVIISVHAAPLLKMWVEKHNIPFPVLSDYWPHGATAQAYGCFNEQVGVAMRATYVLDSNGMVKEIIQTGALGEKRDHALYAPALSKA
jgi:peroxiredoxin